MTIKPTILFCDDVRIEQSGKHIIIGVYLNDLIPQVVPSTVIMSLWVKLEGLPTGNHEFKIRVQPPQDAPPLIVDGVGDNADGDVALVVAGLPIELRGDGDLVVSIAFDGEDEVVAGKIRVTMPIAA